MPVEFRLFGRVWGDRRLPQHPRGAVQHSIALLRAFLAPDVTISWQANGYLLAGDPDTVDLHRFQHLISQARITTDDAHASSAEDADRVQRQLEKIDQTAPVMPAHAGGPRTRT
jgi:hypothetical protein